MGGKRIGLGASKGNVTKQRKVIRKKLDGEENNNFLAIKITAATAVKAEYRDIVLPWIAKTSIEATKMCQLASLLFLHHVRKNHDDRNDEFFNGDGIHMIEECFYAVTKKYANTSDAMLPQFKAIYDEIDAAERMDWPNHGYFGNLIKYFPQEYARNVITNLTTHQKKRLTQFLRLRVYHENSANPGVHFDENDVKNAVSWAIKRYDSTRGNVDRLNKRNHLLSIVRANGGPADDDVSKFTRDNWFKSLPLWLNLQQSIDMYHDWQQQQQQNGLRTPKLKNLSVIPICSHMRKHIRIDADVLYRMLCETKLIGKDENGIQPTGSYVCANKEWYFKGVFNVDKINRMLKANKTFHYQIVSDGVSASILYTVPQTVLETMQSDGIVKRKYYDGQFVYEIGMDPGMKTWVAVVRRHIDTGKEVFVNISIEFHCLFAFLLSMHFNCFVLFFFSLSFFLFR